jgi:hypothetical protein
MRNAEEGDGSRTAHRPSVIYLERAGIVVTQISLIGEAQFLRAIGIIHQLLQHRISSQAFEPPLTSGVS